jgi:uncharacterized membrane protein SirB2
MTGISSFIILVGGMGLLARLGISHKEGWPLWAYLKLGFWLIIVALVPILSKKIQHSQHRKYILVLILGLVFIQTCIIIYKPS